MPSKPTFSKKNKLIDEQTSPLFRMMWIYNMTELDRRKFSHNMCAFHIGNGMILSVAHNLRKNKNVFLSIDDEIYSSEILPNLNPTQAQLFNQYYSLDAGTRKRYLNTINQADAATIIDSLGEALKQINFDARLLTLTSRNICKPYLIVQFKNNQFYKDETLTSHFDDNTYSAEPLVNRHNFFLELELVEAYYSEDFALYKIINTNQDIINRLPSIEVDFRILEENQLYFYCIQNSPNSLAGKLLNKAQIEGFLDQHTTFKDEIGGNYTFEGIRYLIKGYFKFGSSGAPYVFYDSESEKFKVNAIQSQACPIQLSINHSQKGNFQYINAIASPLSIFEDKIKEHIGG